MKKIFIPILLFLILVILVFTVILSVFFLKNSNRKEELNKINIQFAGAIKSKKDIRRSGRISTIICVDLNYTNVQSYSVLIEDHYIYCKVANNVASIVIPSAYSRADSVAVNMNNNRLEQLYRKGELIVEYPLSLSYAYLKIKDLNECFEH